MTTPPTGNKFIFVGPSIEDPLPEDFESIGVDLECGGFQWTALLKYDKDVSGMSMFLACEPINPRPLLQWSAHVRVKTKGYGRHEIEFSFSKGQNIQRLEKCIRPREKGRKHYVEILKSSVIPYTDFSQPNPEIFADTVVNVEDQKFVVSKTTLANISPFFNDFFFVTEHGAEGFVLQDIKAKQFQELLEFLYHTSQIYASNCIDLLEIATHIQHDHIVKKCENFMIENDVCPRKELLLIAHRFGLTNLTDSVIQKQNNLRDVIALLPDNVEDLERETMKKILAKMNDLKKSREEGPRYSNYVD